MGTIHYMNWVTGLETKKVRVEYNASPPEGFRLCFLENGTPINIPIEELHEIGEPIEEDGDLNYGLHP